MHLFSGFYSTTVEWLRRLRRKLFLTEYDLIEFIRTWEKKKEEIRVIERNMLINCVTKSEFDQKMHVAANDIRSLKMLLGKIKKEQRGLKEDFKDGYGGLQILEKKVHAIPRDVDYRKREIDKELEKLQEMRVALVNGINQIKDDYSLYNSSMIRLSSRVTGLENILMPKVKT